MIKLAFFSEWGLLQIDHTLIVYDMYQEHLFTFLEMFLQVWDSEKTYYPRLLSPPTPYRRVVSSGYLVFLVVCPGVLKLNNK